ncbi:hypothetical protein Nit79A3_1849 [Nitrosomonas sp. Is79A3]
MNLILSSTEKDDHKSNGIQVGASLLRKSKYLGSSII